MAASHSRTPGPRFRTPHQRSLVPCLFVASVATPTACGEGVDDTMDPVMMTEPTESGPSATATPTAGPQVTPTTTPMPAVGEPTPSPASSPAAVTPTPTPAATPTPTPSASEMPTPPEPVEEEGGPPVRSTTGPSYATTVAPLVEMKCLAGCHEPNGVLGGPGGFDPLVMMDLKGAAGYETLTNQMSLQVPTMWLVGETLEDSYLWHKLNDTQETVGGMGAKMPVTGEWTEEDMAVVQAWIEGGASP
jgi:hypothetical protein